MVDWRGGEAFDFESVQLQAAHCWHHDTIQKQGLGVVKRHNHVNDVGTVRYDEASCQPAAGAEFAGVG